MSPYFFDIVFYLLGGFSICRILILISNLFYSKRKTNKQINIQSLTLSILVPVRNEVNNVDGLINSILQNATGLTEIIFMDDDSSDGTYQSLLKWELFSPLIKVYKGKILENGWLGKNYACHQLGLMGNKDSDYLLFLDADTRLLSDTIPNILEIAYSNEIDLLTVFPYQKYSNAQTEMVIPLMHYILLTLLPISLIQNSKWTSFSAGNGQCMLFERDKYLQVAPHNVLKNVITEDIESVRLFKKLGYKCRAEVGLLNTMMYNTLAESINGFSKNIFAGFKNNIFFAIGYLFFVLLGYIIVLLGGNYIHLIVLLLFSVIIKILVSYQSKNSVIKQVLFQPLMIIIKSYIILLSIYKTYSHNLVWKGRKI